MKLKQCGNACPFLCTAGVDGENFNPVLPDGPAHRILAIGEAPGADEVAKSYGFAGIAGRNLTLAFEEQGILRENWARTNAVWCRPEKDGTNRKPTPLEIQSCQKNLDEAIQQLKPRVILVVGETAASAIGIYNKKIDGAWLAFVLKSQSDFKTNGVAALRWHYCPVVLMPHTSPLSWNRRHNDQPIREIGKISVGIAAQIIIDLGKVNRNRLA